MNEKWKSNGRKQTVSWPVGRKNCGFRGNVRVLLVSSAMPGDQKSLQPSLSASIGVRNTPSSKTMLTQRRYSLQDSLTLQTSVVSEQPASYTLLPWQQKASRHGEILLPKQQNLKKKKWALNYKLHYKLIQRGE